MSLSSFCVVTNALRLNLFKVYDSSHDGKQKGRGKAAEESIKNKNIKKEEGNEMKKTMKIEGMMCGHCEARVKKSLEALDGVSEAAVSHESGTAVVKLSGEVSDAALTMAVEDQDYTVLGIQ